MRKVRRPCSQRLAENPARPAVRPETFRFRPKQRTYATPTISRQTAKVAATSAASFSSGNLGGPGVLGDAPKAKSVGGQRTVRKKSTPKKPKTPAQHLLNVYITSTFRAEKCLTRPASPRHGVGPERIRSPERGEAAL
jgi:hypothetical protein